MLQNDNQNDRSSSKWPLFLPKWRLYGQNDRYFRRKWPLSENTTKMAFVLLIYHFDFFSTATFVHFRRPGFSNSLFPSWDSWFLTQMFAYQARRPRTKTRMSAMTIRTGTRDSKSQGGEDVDVLRSPALDTTIVSASSFHFRRWVIHVSTADMPYEGWAYCIWVHIWYFWPVPFTGSTMIIYFHN